ncbi:uncharacterized protein H6S33_006839 [Morchella sextelata]|uniref:uncharacterized protein n=1 Tax=Morchella sextelata TaxID=1174677 RepID=UPI001D03CCA6|nr:uncharacterized protein H6S33_006839 [Morchella sextelata]KAH0604462.1 hypothetical protein H6S33_006839 [Morchella sextelata]
MTIETASSRIERKTERTSEQAITLSPEREASFSGVSVSPLENRSGSEPAAVENVNAAAPSECGSLKETLTPSAGSEHLNMDATIGITRVPDNYFDSSPNTYTGPTLQPLLKLTSATDSSLNREHYIRVCIDTRLEVTIISSDYGATVPWPDYTVTWELFGINFMLEGTQIWHRADLPTKGVDGIFGLGFLQRFNYMSFVSISEGYIMPSRFSLYPLLPYDSSDQRTLRIYTDIAVIGLGEEPWRPILGIGVFLGPEVSLNTWIPCFGDHLLFFSKSERDRRKMCELVTFETFLEVIESLRGKSNITPFVRVELYTDQEPLVTWWNSISDIQFNPKCGPYPKSYDRFIRLRKRLAIDVGSNENDCLEILSYKDSNDSNRAQILLGYEQAKALAELAIKSSKSRNVSNHDCYLRCLPCGHIWIPKEIMDMAMDKILLACQTPHTEGDKAGSVEANSSNGAPTGRAPGISHLSSSSDNLNSKEPNSAKYIVSSARTSPDIFKKEGSNSLPRPLRLTDGVEDRPLHNGIPEFVVDHGTDIGEQLTGIICSNGAHKPKAKRIEIVSQVNSHDYPDEFSRETYEITGLEILGGYQTVRENQHCDQLARTHANEIVLKAQAEADRIVSQAKLMWAEGIDSHIMASAMATKTRLDAEADAQNIWLKTLGEIQNMKSKALRDIRYHEEDLKKRFGVARPDPDLVAPQLQHTGHYPPKLIIDEANEKANEILESAERMKKDILEKAAESVRLAEEGKGGEVCKAITNGSQNIKLVKTYFAEQAGKVKFAEEVRKNAEERMDELEIETEQLIKNKAQIQIETEEILKKTEERISEAKKENEAILEHNKRLEEDILAKAMEVRMRSEDMTNEAIKTQERTIAQAEKIQKDGEISKLQGQRIVEDAKVEAEKIIKEASVIMQQVMKERVNEEEQRAAQKLKYDQEMEELKREHHMCLMESQEIIRVQGILIEKQTRDLAARKTVAGLVQEKAELVQIDLDKGKKYTEFIKAKKEADKARKEAENAEKEAEKAKQEAEAAKKEIEKLKKIAETLERDIGAKKTETEEAKKEAGAVKESVENARKEADLIRTKAKTDAANITEQALKVKKDAEDSKSRVVIISEKIKAEAREEASKIKAHADKIMREAEAKKREATEMSKKIVSEAEARLQASEDAEIAFAITMKGEQEEALRVQKETTSRKIAETNKLCEDMKKNSTEKIKNEYKKIEEEQEKIGKAKKNLLEETASQKKKAKDEARKLLDKANEEANQIIENAMKAQDDYPIRGDVLGSALPLTPERFYQMFLEPKDSEDDGPLSAEDFTERLEAAEAEITLGQIINHCPDAAKAFFRECEQEERFVHRIELYKDAVDERLKFKKGERIIPFTR